MYVKYWNASGMFSIGKIKPDSMSAGMLNSIVTMTAC